MPTAGRTLLDTCLSIFLVIAFADRVEPTFSSVSITSNNTNNRRARPNDLITLSFTTSEAIKSSPLTVKFCNQNTEVAATEVANSDGKSWTAEYVATSNARDDGSAINFTITIQDLAGNDQTTTTLTNSSNVIFYST